MESRPTLIEQISILKTQIKFCGYLCLLIFLLTMTADGQYLPFRFEKYSVDQGLSNQTVTCSLRDRMGYLWVGTENGLNRFDGYNFKQFLADSNNKGSLQDGSITTLLKTAKGLYGSAPNPAGCTFLTGKPKLFTPFKKVPKTKAV